MDALNKAWRKWQDEIARRRDDGKMENEEPGNRPCRMALPGQAARVIRLYPNEKEHCSISCYYTCISKLVVYLTKKDAYYRGRLEDGSTSAAL